MKHICPKGYQSELTLLETQQAIKILKDCFQQQLSAALNLTRVSAPLFVRKDTGLNDDLCGVERKVAFDCHDDPGVEIQVVQSLAKWKRYALGRYGYPVGQGLYTDMNAIRRDEITDNFHSIYVDQWDWEKVIRREDRNPEFLKDTVRSIHRALYNTLKKLRASFPEIEVELQGLAAEREDGLYDRDKADEDLREQLYELEILPSDEKTYRVYVQGQVLQAQLARSALEREQFLLRLEERERKLSAEREEILAGERDLTVIAPVSGVVTGLHTLSPGENCEAGRALLRVYAPERYLLRAGEGILGELRVGQAVTIEYGPADERKTAPGVVVSAQSLLPPDLDAGGAAVAVQEDIPAADLVNPSVVSQEKLLEDALLLPRTAVGSENGQSYVLLRKDGSPRKRFVQVGPQSNDQVVILDGVTEGQEVVLP